MGGGWGARSDEGTRQGTWGGSGDARRGVVAAGGDAEDLGGLDVESFDQSDFEFQIASF
ncbi:hypothetical protein LILAB_32850 [Corallococcus macrosporus]|uniref:Uncharacterized protein n=1 Tax=Myxococcus fulvus (strain ATCC BAA-855 / HW-1) TaxID=483219 RepID=F8CCB7_MYXFH|nr:hypothetical protein LILAB_32850 [Corallococcus macrosporus]